MSARTKRVPRDRREHPGRSDRAMSWRRLRRVTRTMLHVSLTEDPELDDTPLPVPQNDATRIVVDEEPPPRRTRRLRHWKTRDWKRRNVERRRRAAALRGELDH